MVAKGYLTRVPTSNNKLFAASPGAPDFAPDFEGQSCYDTTNDVPYVAIGTAAAATSWGMIASGLLTGSTTWDAASIADGDEAAQEITVTGAVLGDFVISVSMGVDVTDLVITGAVTAADTVTAILANNTGGAIDLASTTVRAVVLPKDRVGL